jgi:hypothetical protein
MDYCSGNVVASVFSEPSYFPFPPSFFPLVHFDPLPIFMGSFVVIGLQIFAMSPPAFVL